MKTAFITGITGQDGSYLAELLLGKNYQVVGLISKKHNIGDQNIASIKKKLILEIGDLLDKDSLKRIIVKHKPQEIYNLGGITFIPQSWELPELTFNINALGVLRILEIVRTFCPQTKIFQATSAKIFGDPTQGPQTEEFPIKPLSPYSVSKACGHFLVGSYRQHFGIYTCSGIMYNHESERRGPEFVTRKITQGAAKIKLHKAKKLILGNINAKQDWGYAPDFVEAMWLMLQQQKPQDYILATGKVHAVKDICLIAFKHLGLRWQEYVSYDKDFLRKEEPQNFFGDINKAKNKLCWEPKVDFEAMIKKMVDNDLKLITKGER